MPVDTQRFEVSTEGNTHVLDVTPQVRGCLKRTSIRNGAVTVFVVASLVS